MVHGHVGKARHMRPLVVGRVALVRDDLGSPIRAALFEQVSKRGAEREAVEAAAGRQRVEVPLD
eukprot:scaffold62248_cov63-Phaeocystis_antarctica.AAC.2